MALFENATSLSASMARTSLPYSDLTLAIVVAKASCEVGRGGIARLLPEQLPTNEGDVETPFGTIDGDVVPVKDRCDLAVMGNAYAPEGRPTSRMEVGLSLGTWRRRVTVFGDRVWEGRGERLRPSAPQPFVEMPLTYDRSFGGLSITGEVETGCDDNPQGRGFIYREQDAPGVPLPNLEESDQLIHRWNDRPMPAGLAPLPRQSVMRLARGTHVDLEAGVTQILPAMFSFGHPRMRLPDYPVGQRLLVQGMRPEGDWSFVVPDFRAVLDVRLGESEDQLELKPDTLCMFPSYGRFFVLARASFVYQFVPRRVRTVRLRWAEPGETRTAVALSLAQREAAGDTSLMQPEAKDSPIPFDLMRELYPLRNIVEGLPVFLSG
jgi:Uncharacterized protein conserved in bacteria (DUF2169)